MVRNLKEISIKIYMVDLEKHCIESTKPFDLEANLKYLTTPICKILQV